MVRLRGLGVFVDQAIEDFPAAYPGGEIGGGCRRRLGGVGWSLISALMWPVLVVVADILAQRRKQMPRVVDEHPVQAFTRTVRTHRSAYALAFGACGGVRSTLMLSAKSCTLRS